MTRLVPWLDRELHYLLNENTPHKTYVLNRILELLPLHHITSPEFREAMQYFFGDRTEHFLHELHCFASTPYDLTGYDRHVQYSTDPRISTMVNEVISSSDSEASVDSDIVMVSSSEPTALPLVVAPTAGPSHPAPRYPPANTVIPIETISHSDTDDESEVMVVGYIKPPQDRTPEVVDLLGSDSDVVVQETPAPAPGPSHADQLDSAANVPLVKLSLKRHHPAESGDSDSDANYVRPQHSKTRKRRRRSNDSATTANTWRGTPSPPLSDHSWRTVDAPSLSTVSLSIPSPSSAETSVSVSVSSSTWTYTSSSSSSSDSDSSHSSRHRKARKKSRRKTTKKRSKSKSKSRKEKRNQSTQIQRKEKNKEKKSHSGKDVKSSKRKEENEEARGLPEPSPDQPSTSGVSNREKRKDKSKSDRANRASKERSRRERKRLKSVVKVMSQQSSEPSAMSNLLNIVGSAILNPNSNVLAYNSDSGSIPGDERTSKVPAEILEKAESCFNVELSLPAKTKRQTDNSDSEDDLPLNLTMNRS